MKKIDQNSGKIQLSGQHSCCFELSTGVYQFHIRINTGKIRLNHGCFTPDGGTWLDAPNGGRIAHYDLSEGRDYDIEIDIRTSFGRTDRICLVNLSFIKKAIFQYSIEKKNN